MSPEELFRDLSNAFNWKGVKLQKTPKHYSLKGGPNMRLMTMPMKSSRDIQLMRDSVTNYVRGLKEIEPSYNREGESERPSTGYYFQRYYFGEPNSTIGLINYYDSNTNMITICNLKPALMQKPPYTYGEYFFFNEITGSKLMLGDTPPITALGHYYSLTLPNQYNFINWVNANPLSSRK